MARKCRFDDVGLDFIQDHGTWYLIEANMKYGRRALKNKGMDLKAIIRDRVLSWYR
jgi:ribosomal protein S6--L-glutamate ligase